MIDNSYKKVVYNLAGILAFLGQILIAKNTIGVYLGALCLAGYFLGLWFITDRQKWYAHPIPMLGITGFWCYYFAGPLFIMTVSGHPLARNLLLPVETFSYAIYTYIAVLIGFKVYQCYLSYAVNAIKGHVQFYARKVGWSIAPTDFQVWFFGFTGVIATFFASVNYENPDAQGGIGVKLLAGYIPYAIAPFMLPLRPIWDKKAPKILQSRYAWSVGLYFTLVILIGLIRNSRATIFLGVFTLLIGFIFAIKLKYLHIPVKQRNLLLVFAILGSLLLPVSMDLATSMVVVRQKRSDVSSWELIGLSLQTLTDKGAIKDFQATRESRTMLWEEEYTGSVFFDRLCNVRYLDLSLFWGSQLDIAGVEQYRRFEFERFFSFLPSPLIQILSLNVDKEYANSMSGGDQILYLATSDITACGGFRVGSLIGASKLVFGPWIYVFPLVILIILIWSAVDLLTPSAKFRLTRKAILPFAFVLMLFPFICQLTSAGRGIEGVYGLGAFLSRAIFQTFVLYVVMQVVSRWVGKGFSLIAHR